MILDRLEQLRTEATPGEWKRNGPFVIAEPGQLIVEKRGLFVAANLHLIVAAVNALPALLRIARAAEAHVRGGWCESNAAGAELRSALSDLEAQNE